LSFLHFILTPKLRGPIPECLSARQTMQVLYEMGQLSR